MLRLASTAGPSPEASRFVLALIVTVHLFTPVDLDEYEQRLRRILHLPASTTAT